MNARERPQAETTRRTTSSPAAVFVPKGTIDAMFAGASPAAKNAQVPTVEILVSNGQPVENAARNIWTQETAFTTALNASYMAEQMANFGIVVGIALLLSGIGFMILALGGALEAESVFAGWRKKSTAEAKSAAVAGV